MVSKVSSISVAAVYYPEGLRLRCMDTLIEKL